MSRLSARGMSAAYGRPDQIRGVPVQSRLPWAPPRSGAGNVQVVLVHPLLVDVFLDACGAATRNSSWRPRRIDSHVVRPIRGLRKPRGWKIGDEGTSSHSWCTAWDMFATPSDVPPPGGVWTPANGLPAEFAAEFEKRGFTWGGRWKRTDLPHLEWRQAPPVVSFAAAFDSAGNVNPADWLSSMLKEGDVGDDVWGLQFVLRAVGRSEVVPSGVFGPVESGAVRGVQEVTGSVVDGIVGPQTEQALLDLISVKYSGPEAIVSAAYDDVFGRGPDPEGLSFWSARIARDLRIDQLWQALWDSPEAVELRSARNAPVARLPVPVASASSPVGLSSEQLGQLASITAQAESIIGSAGRVANA